MSQIIVKDALEGVGAAADTATQVSIKFSRRGTIVRIGTPGGVTSPRPTEVIQLSLTHPISIGAQKLSCVVAKYLHESGRVK